MPDIQGFPPPKLGGHVKYIAIGFESNSQHAYQILKLSMDVGIGIGIKKSEDKKNLRIKRKFSEDQKNRRKEGRKEGREGGREEGKGREGKEGRKH